MELGETLCIPNGKPKCDACPLANLCVAYHTEQTDTLPVKAPKKARKDLAYTVLLLECNGCIALQKRPKEGLLAGLWEFPNTEGHLTESEIISLVHSYQTEPLSCTSCGSATHVFTHLNWNMIGYHVRCSYESEAFTWVSLAELRQSYALPTAFRFYQKQGEALLSST